MYHTQPDLNMTYYSSVETNDLKYGVLRYPQGGKNPTKKGVVCMCFMRRETCRALVVKDVTKEIDDKYLLV
jgi:hypothetical protein